MQDFLNKRITGTTTLLGRRRKHLRSVLDALLDDIVRQGLDHTAVTGDISNLSLEGEFRTAARLLGEVGRGGDKVSVVPGNHDVYIRKVARQGLFEDFFGHFMQNRVDLPGTSERTNGSGSPVSHPSALADFSDGETYPYVKIFDQVALVGVNSALPRPWFSATGRVGEDQIQRLQRLLQHPEVRSRFVVVMLHHPVLNAPYFPLHRFRQLHDATQFRETMASNQVGLILTGHSHERYSTRFAHDRHVVEVRSVPAGSFKGEHPGRRACYAIHDIDQEGIRDTEYRVYDAATGRFRAEAVEPLRRHPIHAHPGREARRAVFDGLVRD